MKLLQIICLFLAAMALPALAQQKARPDPADPGISVPPAVYVSPLRQYRPLGDEKVTSWKTANELVEKIGGWKAYAREAQEPAPGTGPSAAPAVPPAPPPQPPAHDGHAGHKKN